MKIYLPAIGWAIVVFLLSTMNVSINLPEIFFSPDKIAHIVVYGILTALFLVGLKKEGKYNRSNNIWTVVICSAYGALMEVIQYTFFPGRYFEIGDALANLLGCIIALLLFNRFLKPKI